MANLFLLGVPDGWSRSGHVTDHSLETNPGNFDHTVLGDADKVCDLASSVPYRGTSHGSGSMMMRQEWSTIPDGYNLERSGLLIHGHNLTGAAAKVRALVYSGLSRHGRILPTTTVSEANLGGATHTAVDEGCYNQVADYTTPAVTTSPWHIEVGFANSDPLALGADLQIALVRMRARMTAAALGPIALTIEVKEGATVRASKVLSFNFVEDLDEYVFMVLFTAGDFTDTTCAGMSIRVTSGSGTSTKWWEPVAIDWWHTEVLLSDEHDTGWISLVDAPVSWGAVPYWKLPKVNETIAIPYVDANGNLRILNRAETTLWITWDDVTLRGPVYNTNSKALTWRPEIGMVMEGPGYQTDVMGVGFSMGTEERSAKSISSGGHDWVRHRKSPRTLDLTLNDIAASVWGRDLWEYLRRIGSSAPIGLAILPDHPTGLDKHLAMVARLSDGLRPQNVFSDAASIALRLKEWI